MVEFEQTMGGYKVIVNGQHFGWISKEHGFFIDPTVIKIFMEVTAKDLRDIADKASSTVTGY